VTDLNDLVDRYVAVWNEPDPQARRQRVAELWTPDGSHYTQTREFHGHPALEERVAEAYGQFVAGGAYRFSNRNNAVGHHDAVKFNWGMVSTANGDTVAIGFDVLLLDEQGRIVADYQFNDPPQAHPELEELVDRYIAVWNAGDDTRHGLIEQLWAADGSYVDHSCVARGRDDVEAIIAKAHDSFAGSAVSLRPARNADGHHRAVRFNWTGVPADGGPTAASGQEFLLLDSSGRITADYQFIEPF
jgi:hypothetical protein